MIRKSGNRFSEKLMLKQKIERDDDSTKSHPALEWFRNGHNLDLLVDRRCRTGGVLQLLLAQTDRLKAF